MPETPSALDRLTHRTLQAGTAIPLLYFGLQVVVAPFYPGYRFITDVASLLGSDRSPGAPFFNGGIDALGILTLAAGFAVWRALLRSGTRAWLAWPLPLAFLVSGVQSLWAATFPLPDPRHGGHPLFVVAMIAMPFLVAATLWRSVGGLLRGFFALCMLIIVGMTPIMSGKTSIDPHAVGGLAQRALAFPVFVPMGVACYVLAKRWAALEC